MALNHHFWKRAFQRDFVPQLRGIVDAVERRLLPAFETIGDEADAVADEAWEAFMSSPGTGDEYPGDYAEEAQDAGLSHYTLLSGIRQGMLNMFAATLFHAFEQQMMFFLRREVLDPREEHDFCRSGF
jgi:hypothetical protein